MILTAIKLCSEQRTDSDRGRGSSTGHRETPQPTGAARSHRKFQVHHFIVYCDK